MVTGSGAGGIAGLDSQEDWRSEKRAGAWILAVLAFCCEGGGEMTGEEGGENKSRGGVTSSTFTLTGAWRPVLGEGGVGGRWKRPSRGGGR